LAVSKLFDKVPLLWFVHNLDLCGTVQGLPPYGVNIVRNKGSTRLHKVKLIAVISFVVALFALFIFLGFYSRKRKTRSEHILDTRDAYKGDIFSVWNFNGRVVYEDIIRATENFDEKYCIGSGGNATVYKTIIVPENIILAVKKIHSEDGDTSLDSEAFYKEIRTLTRIRHRNIVKLFGYCSSPRNKFLVYEYHERRDLQNFLNHEVAEELDWPKRREIVKDVACALSYMHHDS
jgi:Protein kinase domain